MLVLDKSKLDVESLCLATKENLGFTNLILHKFGFLVQNLTSTNSGCLRGN